MQENRQHTHKNCDTRYTLGKPSLREKTQPPKASIIMYYSAKTPLQYNHGSLQSHSHHRENFVNKHESTHPMSYLQPSQMLPWLSYQAFFCLTLAFLSFLVTCHTNNYPCGCLYNSKSHKTTKWYYINNV